MTPKRKNSQFSPDTLHSTHILFLVAAYTLTAIPCVFMMDSLIENNAVAFVAGMVMTCILVWTSHGAQVTYDMWRGVDYSDLDALAGGDDDTAG